MVEKTGTQRPASWNQLRQGAELMIWPSLRLGEGTKSPEWSDGDFSVDKKERKITKASLVCSIGISV